MSEMVERVAKAIYEASPFRETAGAFEDQSEIYRRMCRLFARAAIEAMREPTEAMEDAGSEESIMIDPFACNIWEAMINAALREEG